MSVKQEDTPELQEGQEAKASLKRKLLSPTPTTSKSPAPSVPPSGSLPPAHQHHDDPLVAPLPPLVPALSRAGYDFFTTRSYPVNARGYRYVPCAPSSPATAAFMSTLNATEIAAATTSSLYKAIESAPQQVRFSWEDRSPFAFLTKDARTVTAEKGWRAARANVCLREGEWYWEVNVVRGGSSSGGVDASSSSATPVTNQTSTMTAQETAGSWVRIGVSRREGALNAPVGFDGYSYAYRDKRGDAVTLSRAEPYGRPYASGDVIGIRLTLPPRKPIDVAKDPSDPARIVRKRIPIRYRGQLFFESLEYVPSDEMETMRADPADTRAKENVMAVVDDHNSAVAAGDAATTTTGSAAATTTATPKSSKKAPPPGQKVKSEAEAGPPPRPVPRLEGSKLEFFVNGESQGVAFENLFDFVPLRRHVDKKWRKKNPDPHLATMENWHDDGTMGYYPAVSCFGGGTATINPGPDFAFAPPPSPPAADPEARWKPLCERYAEQVAEQKTLDEIDERFALQKLATRPPLQPLPAASAAQQPQPQPLKKGSAGSSNLAIPKLEPERQPSSSSSATPLPVDTPASESAPGAMTLEDEPNKNKRLKGDEEAPAATDDIVGMESDKDSGITGQNGLFFGQDVPARQFALPLQVNVKREEE